MQSCALVGAAAFNADHFMQMDALHSFDLVIAADAGFASLEAIGRLPDIVLGDFDSYGAIPQAHPSTEVFAFPQHKDLTDMALCFSKASDVNQDSVYVYGALSGRLDHTLANLQLFVKYAKCGMRVIGIADSFAITALHGPTEFVLPDIPTGTVSVFAASDAATGVCVSGLEYVLTDALLTNDNPIGISNELIGRSASISVQTGSILVFYPLS